MKLLFVSILMISLNVFADTTVAPGVVDTSAAAATAELPAKAAAADVTKIKETAILLKTKETDIPVHLDGDKKSAPTDSPIFKVIMSLSVIGILGCGAFFWIKKYAKKGNSKSAATQIKVLTQHYLGPKKSLAIIRVAGESILVGITDHNISLIKELSLIDDEIPEATPKSFKTVFAIGQDEGVNFASNDDQGTGEDEDSRDEFSISGIKDFVSSKLKNMRSIE